MGTTQNVLIVSVEHLTVCTVTIKSESDVTNMKLKKKKKNWHLRYTIRRLLFCTTIWLPCLSCIRVNDSKMILLCKPIDTKVSLHLFKCDYVTKTWIEGKLLVQSLRCNIFSLLIIYISKWDLMPSSGISNFFCLFLLWIKLLGKFDIN